MKCYSYLENNNYVSESNKAIDFYYGKQWTAPTKTNKNIPRAMFNICKLQINNKQANICSIPVSLKFFTNNSQQDTKFVTSFAKYLLKEMKHEIHRSKVTRDSLIKGTGVSHLYFDQNRLGTFGDYVGGVCEEILDFRNVAVSNPFNKDVQDQKWVIIRSQKSIGSLKRLLNNSEEKIKLLEKEIDEININKETPIQDNDNIFVYLRYFRINGEVYHSLQTRAVTIYKNKPLNPNLIKLDKDNKEIDEELLNLPDEELENNKYDEYSSTKFYRYPISFLTFNDSDESIYGKSDLNDTISTQKYINQLYSMQLLNIINMAWDKYVVMPNALRNQVIDDKSGQVLVDYSNTGNGIKRLGGMNSMSNGVVEMAAQAFNMFRTVTQTTDLYTGQTEQKDIAASALAQLNSQADKPIDEARKKLWSYEEEEGKILELFIKLYYTQQRFSMELSEAELISKGQNSNRYEDALFDSNQYQNMEFHIVCEAIQGTKNSELVQENLLQTLFLNGSWNRMGTHDKETYLEMSPLAETIKDKLKALIEKQKVDEISQYQMQIQQLMEQNQQMAQALQRAKSYIDYSSNINKSMEKSYRDEVKIHQDEVKARDEAVEEILTKKVDETMVKKQM